MNPSALRGVIPPLVTPRAGDGGLDRESLHQLCRYQLDAGVTGLFVGGSTGEAALLNDATRLAALDVAVEAAAGRVPVLFGVIDTGTARVIERARPAADHGAAAVVATPPFYVRPHRDEVLAHFAALRAAIDLPVVAYDIPSATHVRLEPATAAALARAGDVIGLKDSSGDLDGLRTLMELLDGLDFPVLTGTETMTDTALALGARGSVPGLGNVDPAGYVALYDAMRAGDVQRAALEQHRLRRLFGVIAVADHSRIGFTAGALGGFKAAVAHLGVIADPAMWPPLGALTADERAAVARLVDDFGHVGAGVAA